MIWTKIDNYDNTKEIVLSIQNASFIPNSKVHFCITEDPVPDETNYSTLTGPNQWTNNVSPGSNVFYAVENGGICSYWHNYKLTLVNYDIPTKHVDITLTGNETVTFPEGAYIVLQGKSTIPIRYNMSGGTGTFILIQNQMVSYTFSKDTDITFIYSGQPLEQVSYFQGQSPNVTMLSESTQQLLDDIITKMDAMILNMATKAELQVVHRRTYYGQWSDFASVASQGSNPITTAHTAVFEIDPLYDNNDNNFVKDNSIIDFAIGLSITRVDATSGLNIIEDSIIKLSLIASRINNSTQLMNFYCDTKWINENITQITLNRDNTNGRLELVLDFKEQFLKFVSVTSVRSDETKLRGNDLVAVTPESITTYDIDKLNDRVTFTDDTFYNGMIQLFNYSLNDKFKYENKDISVASSIDSTDNIIEVTSTTVTDLKVTLKTRLSAIAGELYVDIPTTIGFTPNQIIGLNFVPNIKGKIPVYLDLVTMGNGTPIITPNGTIITYTIPLWKHTILNYDYIIKPLLVLGTGTDYKMELIYE